MHSAGDGLQRQHEGGGRPHQCYGDCHTAVLTCSSAQSLTAGGLINALSQELWSSALLRTVAGSLLGVLRSLVQLSSRLLRGECQLQHPPHVPERAARAEDTLLKAEELYTHPSTAWSSMAELICGTPALGIAAVPGGILIALVSFNSAPRPPCTLAETRWMRPCLVPLCMGAPHVQLCALTLLEELLPLPTSGSEPPPIQGGMPDEVAALAHQMPQLVACEGPHKELSSAAASPHTDDPGKALGGRPLIPLVRAGGVAAVLRQLESQNIATRSAADALAALLAALAEGCEKLIEVMLRSQVPLLLVTTLLAEIAEAEPGLRMAPAAETLAALARSPNCSAAIIAVAATQP